MTKKTTHNLLYGLVLIGGHSTRMQADKASLDVHGRSQLEVCFDLLKAKCDKAFVSTREDQYADDRLEGFPLIYDIEPFMEIGPLGGILSAMTQHPEASWLVLACDLPYVTEQTLAFLIKERDPNYDATAYISTSDDLPEPLCAIYEAHALDDILDYRKEGGRCPRKFLINSDINLLQQPDKNALFNMNNPAEYRKAKSYFRSAKKNPHVSPNNN